MGRGTSTPTLHHVPGLLLHFQRRYLCPSDELFTNVTTSTAMIDNIIETGNALIQWDVRVTAIASFLLIFILTQVITSVRSTVALRAEGDGKTPPIEPYSIPLLGNLISFAFNTEAFLGKIMLVFESQL